MVPQARRPLGGLLGGLHHQSPRPRHLLRGARRRHCDRSVRAPAVLWIRLRRRQCAPGPAHYHSPLVAQHLRAHTLSARHCACVHVAHVCVCVTVRALIRCGRCSSAHGHMCRARAWRRACCLCCNAVHSHLAGMDHVCDVLGGDGTSCIPGCFPRGQDCLTVGREWSCSYNPEDLREALAAQVPGPSQGLTCCAFVLRSEAPLPAFTLSIHTRISHASARL